MGKESRLLFTSKCIAIPLHKILPHMGKDLSFLPPKIHGYPWLHGEGQGVQLSSTWNAHREGVMLLSSKCILPQPLPKIQHYPSTQILSQSIGKDSSSFKMQNPYKSFPTKSFLYILIFHIIFYLSVLVFSLSSFLLFPSNFLFFFFFFSCFQSWNFSPKWKKLFPPPIWGK